MQNEPKKIEMENEMEKPVASRKYKKLIKN